MPNRTRLLLENLCTPISFAGLPLAMLCLLASPPAEARQGAAVDSPPTRAPTQRALLVGCSEYPHLKKQVTPEQYEHRIRLEGTVNDAELLKSTLIASLGYAAADIETLVGWPEDPAQRPTRKNILERLDRLARDAVAGDTVFLHFGGHGTQIPDRSGDESDGLDEVFLPADARRFNSDGGRIPKGILDEEFETRIDALCQRGAFVIATFDCCHSGTLLRGGADDSGVDDAELRVRFISPDLLGIPPSQQPSLQRSTAQRSDPRSSRPASVGAEPAYSVLYAAQSYRKAPELRLPLRNPNAKRHGLFSFMLARALTRSKGDVSFEDLHAEIVASYLALPYDNAIPQLEGDRRRRVNGSSTRHSSATPTVRANLVADGSLKLGAGFIYGIQKGSAVAVRAIGSGEELCRATVTDVGSVESQCEINTETHSLQQDVAYDCQLLGPPVHDYSLRVAVVDADYQPVTTLPNPIEEFFTTHSKQFPRASLQTCDWLLQIQGDESLQLRPRRSGGDIETVLATTTSLPSELKKIFRVRNLRRLFADQLDPLPEGFEVQLRIGGAQGTPLDTGSQVCPGDRVTIEVSNNSGQIIDATVLLVDAQFGITPIFPRPGHTARLTAVDTQPQQVNATVDDSSLGVEHLLVLAIPGSETSEVRDFSWLAQSSVAVERGASPGLAHKLRELAFGTSMRGWDVEEREQIAGGSILTWETRWPPLQAPQRYPGIAIGVASSADNNETSDPAHPNPWDGHFEKGCWGRTELAGPVDLLLLGNSAPTHVFVDVDRKPSADPALDVATETALIDSVRHQNFDAELAFQFLQTTTRVFYDTNNDGTFDLILESSDDDPAAETRYRYVDQSWNVERGLSVPALKTTHLSWLEPRAKKKLIQRLNALLR